MSTTSTDLDHYEFLTATAARLSERGGVPITVEPSSYWSGGQQQTDCYDIRLPWSTTGPLTYMFAFGWLAGYEARMMHT